MKLPSNKKLISIAVAISVIIAIIGVQSALELKSYSPVHTFSRTVDWRHVHGLGIDPVDRTILYIATHGDFYHSHDGNPPFKVDVVRADYMAFNAPVAAGVPLYASGHPASGGNTGLIKSIDGGQSWESVSKVLEPPVDFHAMSVSKSDPNIIIGFDSGARGLFKTVDAGETWETLQYPDYITSLAISPIDSQIVFAGTGKGIFQSSDGVQSWTLLDEHQGINILALVFDENQTLYASNQFGLSRTLDFGKSWETLSDPDLTITSIAVDVQNKIIYVAGYSPDGYQEVYRSKDDGKSWDIIGTNKGL
ncbi:MAG: WD40/YVTN/BNR-like repeat-containing protein [Nitrosopumilaceae archaeon]